MYDPNEIERLKKKIKAYEETIESLKDKAKKYDQLVYDTSSKCDIACVKLRNAYISVNMRDGEILDLKDKISLMEKYETLLGVRWEVEEGVRQDLNRRMHVNRKPPKD